MKPERPGKKSDTIKFRVPWSLKRDFMERARQEGRPASDIFRDRMEDYLRRPAQRTTQQTLETAMTAVRRHPRRTGFAAIVGAAGISALIAGAIPAGAAPDLKPAFDSADRNRDGVIDLAEYETIDLAITSDAVDFQRQAAADAAWVIHAGAPSLYATPSGQRPADGQSADAFASFDLNRDGRLSLEEWEARFAGASERVFRGLDADGNGVIEPGERRLERLDDDGDGRVSRREFSAALVIDHPYP